MKNKLFILLVMILCVTLCVPCYAQNIKSDKEIEEEKDVTVKSEVVIDDVYASEKDPVTGDLVVKLPKGPVIRAAGKFEDTIRLMIRPIKKEKKRQEWNWLQGITKKVGVNKSAYDIFFVNSKGIRVEAGRGCEVSVISNEKRQDVFVYYIENSGDKRQLKSYIEEYVVKFKMVKNGYYTLLVKNGDKELEEDFSKGDDDKSDKDKDKDKQEEDDELSDKDKQDDDDDKDQEEEDNEEEDDDDSEDDKEPDGAALDDDLQELTAQSEQIDIKVLVIAITILVLLLFLIFFLWKKKKKEEEEEGEGENQSKKNE
ncbi:MAG: hypothetical protein E7262_00915 [Lachnospiraceae bacterium]|nr:hypothetical protein [Lachnospiraceae bacterium]